MNRIITILFVLIASPLLAKPGTNKRPAATTAELSQQIASYVSYPAVMQEGKHEGIVVVTFNVSETNRLSKLTVHTANQELNDDLTRQLVGKKIRLTDNNPFETYTVRLRFVR